MEKQGIKHIVLYHDVAYIFARDEDPKENCQEKGYSSFHV